MPTDENSSTETTETEGAPPAGTEQQQSTTGSEELPPEVLRKQLTEARAEAANYRVKAREAQEALASAKTPEEVEAVKAEFATKVAELERQVLIADVARKHELPDDLAKRLVGATQAELDEDAKNLAKLIEKKAPPADLQGGLTPGAGDDDSDDPRALRDKYGRGRRRRG